MITVAQINPLLGNLKAQLERAQTRIGIIQLLRAIFWSLTIAGSLNLGLRLVEVLLPTFSVPTIAAVTTVFIITLVASIFLAFARTPTLLELAKRADRQFDFQERLSTAWEFAGSPFQKDSGSEITAALYIDAANCASRVNPKKLVPIYFPWVGWWALALAALTLSSNFLVSQRFIDKPFAQVENVEPLSPDERSRTAANLRQAGSLLSGEAEERKDAYLQALAKSFDDLSHRVASGELDRIATQEELAQLLKHIERAYEGESSTLGEALLNQVTPGNEVVKAPETLQEAAADATTDQKLASRDAASSATSPLPGLDSLLSDLSQVEAQLQQAEAERQGNQRRVTLLDYKEHGPYVTAQTLERLERERDMREELQTRAAGQPIGAAQQADKGAGDLAGEGVQPLTGEDARLTLQEGETRLEQVLLPDQQMESGQRIKVDLPPDTRLTAVRDAQLAGDEVWDSSSETELRRDQLGPGDRAVASRYFSQIDPEANVSSVEN